jgi:5-methyltetrahydrofolate--homocysteine methyltransferase
MRREERCYIQHRRLGSLTQKGGITDMTLNPEIFDAIVTGNAKSTPGLVQADLDSGVPAGDILKDSMVPAMNRIGEQFAVNEIYVPQMLIAARAMNAGLAVLEPILADSGYEPVGKVAIGTVKGDLHDIGKNIVAMMLKGAGFQVMDLGTDCDADAFQKAVDDGAQAVCLSAMLTTTMPYMKTIVEHFHSKGDNAARVIIGGAPATQEYADLINADGFASNAANAVKIVSSAIGIASQ